MLERIIGNRLEEFSEGTRSLSENQYGFRKEMSSVDATAMVVDIAPKAISGKCWKRGAKQYWRLVTLDVKNAFTR